MENTVLITGASRGIGAAAAALFARRGWRVAVNYHRSRERALALVEELTRQGFQVMAAQADVADRTQVDKMFAQVRERFGDPGVLINNAGVSAQRLFTEISEEEWDWIFGVHVKGCFHCCQAALPSMLREHRGKLINVSSMWGQTGGSCEVHYSAAKAAVIGLTKALAKEVGPSGIQVNCVAPGVIMTEMNGHLDEAALAALREETPLGVLGTPEDVAGTLFFLASPAADFITGQVISPNGGMVI